MQFIYRTEKPQHRYAAIKYNDFYFFNKSYWQTRKLCKGNDKTPGRVVVLKKYFLT